MVANAIDWPWACRPRSASFHPEAVSRSGGMSISGTERVVAGDAGRWVAEVTIPLMREDAVLSWRAVLAQMNGRAGSILVPKWERYGVRDMNGREMSQVGGAGYRSGFNFDLSGFGQSEIAQALTAQPAALRATEIGVDVLNGQGPRPGQYFGIGNRLYLVSHAYRANEGDPLTVRFWPPLRSAVPTGARMILDRPVCLMRLTGDDVGRLDLDMGLWGTATLSLVEVPPINEVVPVWTGEVYTPEAILHDPVPLDFSDPAASQYLPIF